MGVLGSGSDPTLKEYGGGDRQEQSTNCSGHCTCSQVPMPVKTYMHVFTAIYMHAMTCEWMDGTTWLPKLDLYNGNTN